ncbi:hypothetical protein CHLNCDRAFT_137793 [Chlorella variabilis]|uniref:Uncharacterized protein n=1 Tax=Chlorella variabilis TaxID=554065 RepID=E1Z4I2_CHLVA|nr:hypothetical protein CHLNCDRAFT_137793 [Chlorella variabilis]EFN59349.1 hypothetical protein CHLNCDRAFT_137793 [Chlorella variabilis]|eukprot:XP_005851451.1 hypothetical protein CHLNCDRAFT_137793 [Chlorella variabilis]
MHGFDGGRARLCVSWALTSAAPARLQADLQGPRQGSALQGSIDQCAGAQPEHVQAENSSVPTVGDGEGDAAALHGACTAASLPPVAASAPVQREVRPSSLPQPLGQGMRPSVAGSGPRAPVSPDPTLPPQLQRVSSQPSSSQPSGLSHDSATASIHSSLVADEAGSSSGPPTHRLASLQGSDAGVPPSVDGSRHSSELSRMSSVSGISTISGSTVSSRGSSAAPAAGGARKKRSKRPKSPPPSMFWHPALMPVPEAQRAGSVRSQRSSQRRSSGSSEGSKAPASPPATAFATAAAAAPASASPCGMQDSGQPIPPTAQPGGSSPPLPDSGCGTPASAAVSLLSLQLRGTSAAGSAAASRDASYRSSKRQPMGGLSLALSRESSVRAGSVRSTRENSVRASTRESSVRGASGSHQHLGGGGSSQQADLVQTSASGQRTYRGLAVVGGDAGAEAAGCGSGDWMGVTAAPGGLSSSGGHPAGMADPFGPGAPACAPVAPAADDEAAAQPHPQPQQARAAAVVGSWAGRVTKFPPAPPGKAPARNVPQIGGLDPTLLTAALEALAAEAPHPAGASPAGMLVGDSELAMTGSAEQPAGRQDAAMPPLASGAWAPGLDASGGHPTAVPAAAAVPGVGSSSWSAGTAAAGGHLPPPVQLGGSAPASGLSRRSSTNGSAGGGAVPQRARKPLPSDVAAGTKEWNRSFVKRWRLVKKRAYLQALGMRALWRVNSPSDRHEPLELLTNDLPHCDNGMRRAWSVSRLAAHGGAPSAAMPTSGLRRTAEAPVMHKDPSLAALLLGEVAEVC